ncbi:MAG: IS110 family transposase [Chitinophagaceae bacterium]|jgi:transposase
MKEYKQFFGVDISKKTIDVTLLHNNQNVHHQFTNDALGMQQLLSWLQTLEIKTVEALFCMEATGLYCFTLTTFLVANQIDVWVEHATQIKKSTALARGKNDKVDSLRIATYASKNLERLRLWKPIATALEKIKHLATLRERIVETQKKLVVPIKEFEDVGNAAMAKMLAKTIKKSIDALEADLKRIENQIIKIINEDKELCKKYNNAISVVGIGFVTAVNLMVHTDGFTQINDVRKLACYCGVAPFEYSSGSSIRGKTKVHFMANKKLKSNLHMASLTAIKLDIDLKAYYDRKCAEGKNKMSVLNAVRNKLLARVLACVNNDKLYVNNVA